MPKKKKVKYKLKKLGVVACACNLSTGRWRQVDTWNSLAGQPRLLVEFPVNGMPCLKNKQNKTLKKIKPNQTKKAPEFALWPPRVCERVYTHTHSNSSVYWLCL